MAGTGGTRYGARGEPSLPRPIGRACARQCPRQQRAGRSARAGGQNSSRYGDDAGATGDTAAISLDRDLTAGPPSERRTEAANLVSSPWVRAEQRTNVAPVQPWAPSEPDDRIAPAGRGHC